MAEALVARGTTTSAGNTSAIDVASTNHLCSTTFNTDECSANVFVHRRGVVRLGDDGQAHLIGDDPPCANHTPSITNASPTVYVNNIKVACFGHNYNTSENISTVNHTNVFADS